MCRSKISLNRKTHYVWCNHISTKQSKAAKRVVGFSKYCYGVRGQGEGLVGVRNFAGGVFLLSGT